MEGLTNKKFDPERWLTVGKLVGLQGLKGELRVNPSSEFPERSLNQQIFC